jgi:hypothetical protein
MVYFAQELLPSASARIGRSFIAARGLLRQGSDLLAQLGDFRLVLVVLLQNLRLQLREILLDAVATGLRKFLHRGQLPEEVVKVAV